MQDRAHTWLFYAADSCLNETKWKTDSADLLKTVGNAMWVFLIVLFSFGAQSFCDWVMAFLPDICNSVVVNMIIILKLSMCLCMCSR